MAAKKTAIQEGPLAQYSPEGLRVGDLITLSMESIEALWGGSTPRRTMAIPG